MATFSVITSVEAELLRLPHIARCWFLDLFLPDPVGRLFLHSGVGSVYLGGVEWRGVNDEIGGRLVGIGQVEEPRVGAAAAVAITLTGADRAFLKSYHDAAALIEGAPAVLYYCVFDQETQQAITRLVSLFPAGRCTSPSIKSNGIGVRQVTLTIESLWSSLNFAPGGRWTDADHQRLVPGDRGLEYVGVKVSEGWE